MITIYNERNKPAEVLFQDAAGSVVNRIEFSYDADGDWVTKTVEGRGYPDAELTKSSVETRRIEYFS